jgi:energy-coupling factor transporter transmembrane protein EcfT
MSRIPPAHPLVHAICQSHVCTELLVQLVPVQQQIPQNVVVVIAKLATIFVPSILMRTATLVAQVARARTVGFEKAGELSKVILFDKVC